LGFRADELQLLLQLLPKPSAGEDTPTPEIKPRPTPRPKPVTSYKYGEIKIEPKNIANYQCKGIVAKWDLFDAPEYEEVLNLLALLVQKYKY
jgi:hypothetical protein